MNFNRHSDIEGYHAFLSPSKYHWINYTEEKLVSTYKKWLAVQQGVRLHAFACESINLGIRLPKSKKTLNLYINDCIGYKMETEQMLKYSDNCFGTADAISFRNNFLRIHDYKSGESPASMHQLEIYAALFCLEYEQDPKDINIELRLYQADQILVHRPAPEDIHRIMTKIVFFDALLDKLKGGEE